MKKIPLIIFGNTEIAKLAHFYFSNDSNFEIVAFTVGNEFINNTEFCDCPIVPFENIENLYPTNLFQIFIAVGYSKLNSVRSEFFLSAKRKGYKFASYISSNALVLNEFNIGENCFILENNVIQPYAKIGNNVFLWSGNHIGHSSIIRDNVYIASQSVISGNVEIGSNSFIGVNVTIRDNVKIGDRCLIGAGSIILSDTDSDGIYSAAASKRSIVSSRRFKGI